MPATGLDRLAPDQRAAVELVLRQGRSYGELSDLLGMPEETIRTRARSGLAALAPDLPAPARSGEIADWLLGQQAQAHAARTRALLLSDPEAHRWTATVAKALRDVPGGESVPALPTGSDEPNPNGKAEPPPAPTRSSRLGGAILIGATVLLVGAVLAFVLLRGGAKDEPTTAATPTATASATAAATKDIVLTGPAGSKTVGVMRLFQVNDGTTRFALAATGVEPNQRGETYSVWFRKKDGAAQLLGDVKSPVGSNGELTSAGPGNADVDKFPQWFATYDNVIVTLDEPKAKEPGKVVLSGDLPHAQTG